MTNTAPTDFKALLKEKDDKIRILETALVEYGRTIINLDSMVDEAEAEVELCKRAIKVLMEKIKVMSSK